MLNEQAVAASEIPFLRSREDSAPKSDPYSELREQVASVLTIHSESVPENSNAMLMMMPSQHQYLISFEGELHVPSEQAYDALDALLLPRNRFAVFRNARNNPRSPHEIHIIQGRVKPVEGRPWINLVMFLLTLASLFFFGAAYTGAQSLTEIWRGYPYALSLMLILGAHELGHYFAARYHKHAVSLPYFIPLPPPIGIGTLGAFIRSRQPMKNRRVLIDVGAAGPLAGLVFAIPILIIGLATSEVNLIPAQGMREGNSVLYALLKFMVFGEFYPTATQDVFVNQMALAGWLGLLVTALNLIPIGQLDGGHVVYSLFGERARHAYYPVLVIMLILSAFAQTWLLWAVLLLLMGRSYAPPLDDITPLDNRRRMVAWFTLAMFLIVFVPRPLTSYSNSGTPVPNETLYQQEAAPAEAPLAFSISRDDGA